MIYNTEKYCALLEERRKTLLKIEIKEISDRERIMEENKKYITMGEFWKEKYKTEFNQLAYMKTRRRRNEFLCS